MEKKESERKSQTAKKRLAVASLALATSTGLAIGTSKGMPGETWGASLTIPIFVLSSASAIAVAIYGAAILIPRNGHRD